MFIFPLCIIYITGSTNLVYQDLRIFAHVRPCTCTGTHSEFTDEIWKLDNQFGICMKNLKIIS